MKFLTLSGHGASVKVSDGKLHVQDGRSTVDQEPESFVFTPKRIPYDNIVVYGHSGHITFEAMKWLSKQNVQLTLLNWDGRLLTTLLPPEARQTQVKFAQYRVYQSEERISLAKNFIYAKIKNTKVVLSWLKEKYPEIDDKIESEYKALLKAKNIRDIMAWEGRVAAKYWKELSKIFDKKFEFNTRMNPNRPFGAIDPINALFNYGYGILESHCRKAINTTGMDTHVGFLHEVTQGKTPLVYDLQEPFRCLIDIAVINVLEKKLFDKKDFIRTENYNIRLKPSGAKKLTEEIEKVMSMTVPYRDGNRQWAYVILTKASELALFLQGKRKRLDFSEPVLTLTREDDYELRQKILGISYSELEKYGLNRSTLHYLKKQAKSSKPFKVYPKVRGKLI